MITRQATKHAATKRLLTKCVKKNEPNMLFWNSCQGGQQQSFLWLIGEWERRRGVDEWIVQTKDLVAPGESFTKKPVVLKLQCAS